MQAIAREFNLSETIFFLPPDKPKHTAKVRIFLPSGELPFAGHPTIGGAIAYAGWMGLGPGAQIVLEEGVGPITCQVTADSQGGLSSFAAPRLPVPLLLMSSETAVAKALRLKGEKVGFDAHKVMVASGGVPYVTVPVADLETLGNAKIDPEQWLALDVEREGKIASPYLYCRTGNNAFQTRMFAPWDGIPEDPATGSAAVAFAATLHRFGAMTEGVHDFAIMQGVEMGRPSRIGLSVSVSGNVIERVAISGRAVKTASGTLYLPD